MKKTFILTVLAVIPAILLPAAMSAQTLNGLKYGEYYSNDQVAEALGAPEQYGDNQYAFDASGRLVGADIKDDKCVVGLVTGKFKVGDDLKHMLYIRADIEKVGELPGVCCVRYTEKGRSVIFYLYLDENNVIREISRFGIVRGKERQDMGDSRFFQSIPSVKTAVVDLRVGDLLEYVLDYEMDVEFTGYGNGICRIHNDKRREQYLLRYDMDHVIREILPIFAH